MIASYPNIPQQNGNWDGAAGNSNFYPDPDFVPKSQSNREHWSWRQILDYYKIDCIPFKNGYPVFPKNIVYEEISLKNFSHKPDTDNRKINFIQADKELARQKGWTEQEARSYRETETASTWHESEDCQHGTKAKTENNAACTDLCSQQYFSLWRNRAIKISEGALNAPKILLQILRNAVSIGYQFDRCLLYPVSSRCKQR